MNVRSRLLRQNKKQILNINMKTVKSLVLVNAYKCAKFQLPSSISYWDMEGAKNKNWELLISSDVPLADTFLHVALVSANAYQRTKFKLSSSISFGDMRGVPK